MNYDLDNILQFEFDRNGFPKLTEKNVKLINFIIENDSNYRSDNDDKNENSTIKLVQIFKKYPDKKSLENIVKAIDKQNSTHLSVSGQNKGDNKGIVLTANYIYNCRDNIYDLIKQIQNGTLELVDDIAKNAIANRYIISFSSKFCTYMSRYMFNNDSYSIYDNVLIKILPYYYYQYIGENIKITSNKIKKNGYTWYSSIIEKIIEKVKEKENYNISRKDLDHLLWYYYKGDKLRITEALKKIQIEN